MMIFEFKINLCFLFYSYSMIFFYFYKNYWMILFFLIFKLPLPMKSLRYFALKRGRKKDSINRF